MSSKVLSAPGLAVLIFDSGDKVLTTNHNLVRLAFYLNGSKTATPLCFEAPSFVVGGNRIGLTRLKFLPKNEMPTALNLPYPMDSDPNFSMRQQLEQYARDYWRSA